jgi:hypothetical protein
MIVLRALKFARETQQRTKSQSSPSGRLLTTEVRVRLVSLGASHAAIELGVSRVSYVLHIEACCRALSPKPYTVVSEC